jgi:hypothetical protein
MPAHVTHVFNEAQFQFLISSPLGGVAKDLIKRGKKVESRAKRNLGGTTGTGPKRVDTGLLRASITSQLVKHPQGLAVRVGTNVYYARWVHDGTGIYGPRKMKITPRTARALVFRSKIYGAKHGKWAGKVVVRSVKGMRGNPFLADALGAFND